jgi:hypothetical protein
MSEASHMPTYNTAFYWSHLPEAASVCALCGELLGIKHKLNKNSVALVCKQRVLLC